MDRRTFVAFVAGTCLLEPLAVRAQQTGKVFRIGLLVPATGLIPGTRIVIEDLRMGLRDLGWVEGKNLLNRRREGDVLGNLGTLHGSAGSIAPARSNFEAALAVAREVGDRRLEGNVLCNLGLLHQVEGRFDDALGELDSALAVARDLGHARLECIVLCNLGMVYDSLARSDEARDHFEAALAVARELGDRRTEGQILSYLGPVHARGARFVEARQCLDAGETLLRTASDHRGMGILLCGRAETEYLAGVPDAARAAFAVAEGISATVGAGPDSELGLALARVRGLVGQERRP